MKKIIGIIVCTLLIATTFPVMGALNCEVESDAENIGFEK